MRRLTSDIIFDSASLDSRLVSKSVRGGLVTMFAQGGTVLLQTAGTIVLARILTPADYGLIGMVTVVVNFAAIFKDAGLPMATIQRASISHEQISTLFWINILISVVLGMCILVLSPLVAAFYGKPELTAVTAALSFSFMISGLGIQHVALLRRHMRFGSLAIVQIVAQIITLVVTILLGLYGWRYWAIVAGSLASALVSVLMIFALCPWVPGRIGRGTGVRNMLMYGGHVTGFNFINYFARNSDNVLIGKFIGADALGIYAKAYQLCMLPITQIRSPLTNVAMPVLSSLKEQPDRYARYYYRLTDILATITVPIMVYFIVEADFLIELLLGQQWIEVIPVFRILAITGIIEPTFGTVGVVLLSLGYSKRYLKIGVFNGILITLSFVLGVHFGVIGVAIAFTIISYLKVIPSIFYCFKKTPIKISHFLLSYVPPVVISIISIGISLLLEKASTINTNIEHFIFLISFFLVYTSASFLRKSVRETAGHVFRMKRKKSKQ